MITFNREKVASHAAPVVLWTWIAFASFYTLASFAYPFIQATQLESARQTGYMQGANDASQRALQSFSGNVFQNGQNEGQQVVVAQLIQALSQQLEGGCKEVVPVTIGTGSIGILSTACLQQLTASGVTATDVTE
ncbi:MAG: hypothetical protein WAW59_04850 [Patescibacteria group bacterium]